MSYVTSGHFTANVDVYSEDEAFVEITMTSKMYTDSKADFSDELADEMRKLEIRVSEYIRHAQAMYRREKYAV